MKAKKIFLILAGFICIATIVIMVSITKQHQHQVETTYFEAVQLMTDGQYADAVNKFESIREDKYEDTEAFIYCCEAAQALEDENFYKAMSQLRQVEFKTLPEEQVVQFEAFRGEVEAVLEEYQRVAAIEAAAKERERIRNGVPFVGMSESDINNTSLGSPSSDVRHNYECIGGEQYLANLYDYMQDGRKIFTARCVRGQVTEVWDHRDDEPYVPTYRPSSDDKDSDDDQYNVNDYSNEEDFYYDHYDDFFDYYDAEAYWNEHHD